MFFETPFLQKRLLTTLFHEQDVKIQDSLSISRGFNCLFSRLLTSLPLLPPPFCIISTLPHSAALSLPVAAGASACIRFSHSSGVKHFGVQAWIAAISVFKAAFTSRWRARLVFFAKSGETIFAWKDDPQPPVFFAKEEESKHIYQPLNPFPPTKYRAGPRKTKLLKRGVTCRKYPPHRRTKPQVFLLVLS